MMKRIMLFLTCLITMVSLATAQSRVTGTVIADEDGQPVLGASVQVKGTTIGTVTDLDGKFTLTGIPSSAKTLVVSYVGMKTQEVSIKANLRIVLESDTEVLDEVMVVAYGTAKKSAFTGSAAVVSTEQIEKVQTSNVVDALNGRVSGVQMSTSTNQPGQSDPTIRIRGISSINAGNSPLIVLDGTPFDGDMNTINTADIESMTVLKDAASNALYGARGANGVIMITTKSGKTGASAKVNVDAKWGLNTRGSILSNRITDPAQYYELYYKYLNNYAQSLGYTGDAANQWANANLIDGSYGLTYNVYSVPTGQNLIGTNGKLNPNATLGNVVNGYTLLPDDWVDAAYKNSMRQEYNVSITNSKEGSNFYASFGYLDNQGIINNSDYQRLSARLKGDMQVKKWLKVGMNASYSHYTSNFMGGSDGTTNDSGNIFAVASQMGPIYPLYIRDANGNIMKDDAGNTRYDYGDGENAGLYRNYFMNSNPLSDGELDTNNSNGNAFSGTGTVEVRFLKDFRFTSTNNVNLDESRWDYVSNPYWGYMASVGGEVYKYHTRTWSYSFQQLLNWAHQFDKHSLELMAGHESYKNHYYYLYGSKSNMSDPTNHEMAGAITTVGTDSYTTTYMTEGWFARAQYNYDEKYFGSVSFRRDASSRFHPDNQWGNFWSAGAAWLISKESWFKAGWINLLKLKASFGQQGNDAIGNYRYTNTYNLANVSGNVAAKPYTMGNKDITWETGTNMNAGVEFELFRQRLTGSVEVFSRKTTDMLFSFPLPPSYGFSSVYRNVGDMRNNGIEVELRGDIIRTKDVTWSLNFNATHYKNKITYLADENKTATLDGYQGYTSGSYFYGENLPVYTFRMKQYAGVDPSTGAALYYVGTGSDRTTTTSWSDADYYNCGTALPDVYGGFGTSLNAFGFDLSVDFAYQLGGQVYDYDYLMMMASPSTSSKGYAMHADLLNAWTPENPNTDVPRLLFADTYAAYSSDRFLASASYLSLQNITLGYNFSRKVLRSLGMEKLRIYVTADNIWYWSSRQGLDPRQSLSGSNSGASMYSPIRTISGGISLTF